MATWNEFFSNHLRPARQESPSPEELSLADMKALRAPPQPAVRAPARPASSPPVALAVEEMRRPARLAQDLPAPDLTHRRAFDLLGYSPGVEAHQRLVAEMTAIEVRFRLLQEFKSLGLSVFTAESVDAYKAQKLCEGKDAKPMRESRWDEQFGTVPTWQFFQMKDYGRPIPTNLLADAVRLKEHFGDKVEILVDALVHVPVFDPFLYATIEGQKFYFAVWDEPTFKPTTEE